MRARTAASSPPSGDSFDSGLPIDLLSGVRYYIDDHKRGVFELGAPTTDVPDVTGQPAEDFETIARRYAALPQNRRTLGSWLREFAQFMIAPVRPSFNLDRYDRELRSPFPSQPQFATESKIWRREHAIAHADRGAHSDSRCAATADNARARLQDSSATSW
jgi:NAD(P)H dehydrogenase (quinone)